MSQESHEARIAELEKAIAALLRARLNDQKMFLEMIKLSHAQSGKIDSISRLLMDLHPELATPESIGFAHKADTQADFLQEKINELEKLINGCTIPPSTEPHISPA